MSRSFRESYMGRPYQAIRGWYQGKMREGAKTMRYKLANMFDEDGLPDFPSVVGKNGDRDGDILYGNSLLRDMKL